MGRIAACMIGALLVAPGAMAQTASELPSVHWSAGVDAGLAESYDESGMWEDGYAAGVSGYYSLETTLLLGGRFGVAHWDYFPDDVVAGLVPPGRTAVRWQSVGWTEVIGIGTFVRTERPAMLPLGFGVFAQGSVQADYVKNYARSEVVYIGNIDVTEKLVIWELNESDWRLGLTVAAGFGRPLTEQSIIEVFPWYRTIFAGDDVIGFLGVSLGWRVRV